MAILKIARMGHPVLSRRAEEIVDPLVPEVQRLVPHMLETMDDADGLGLAAPQIYVPKRLVIFAIPGERAAEYARGEAGTGEGAEPGEAEDDVPFTVLINPVIEPLDDEMELGWEGCLSVPGLRGRVPRYLRIRYGGLSLDGTPIEHTAEGMHARVVQHECDHLDGILYPQRMTDLSELVFETELKHLIHDADERAAAENAD